MKSREALEQTGLRILEYIKTELTLALPFLSSALDRLPGAMEMRTRRMGTDGRQIFFFPGYLTETFLNSPRTLARDVLHMLLHGLFRHFSSGLLHPDRELWDLSADIAAESVADSLTIPALYTLPSEVRSEWYRRLRSELGVLTAEKLYVWFLSNPPDYSEREMLKREFSRCDHAFWPRAEAENRDSQHPPVPEMLLIRQSEDDWKKEAKRLQSELRALGKDAASGEKDFLRRITAEVSEKADYREYLKRFAVLREVQGADPDRFDYGYYYYGLQQYGDMPLIEEYETRELKRVEELAIAIDTSASCQAELVRRFLSETAAILLKQESFFRHTKVLLLECDEAVRNERLFTDLADFRGFAEGFLVHGGGGTDFRPVFRRVAEKQRTGELKDLRGLLYFTDGFGVFPEKPPAYETAFVFCKEQEYRDTEVPDWAMRLYFDSAGALKSGAPGMTE